MSLIFFHIEDRRSSDNDGRSIDASGLIFSFLCEINVSFIYGKFSPRLGSITVDRWWHSGKIFIVHYEKDKARVRINACFV